MSGEPRSRSSTLPRRAFLGVLAGAPCALAACATPRNPAPAVGAGARQASPGSGASASEDPTIAAIRALVLPREAEPACVFRAAPARPETAR